MVRRVAVTLVAVLWGGMLSHAHAQSLAEVARQEAARRERITASGKVLTNADLPKTATQSVAPAQSGEDDAVGQPSAASEGAESVGDAAGGPPDSKPVASAAAAKDDEAGWTQRASSVNKTLADVRAQVRQLRALSDRLSLEMQASDPVVADRAAKEREDVKAQIAQAEAREGVAAAARQALEMDARLAGVPPAWIQ